MPRQQSGRKRRQRLPGTTSDLGADWDCSVDAARLRRTATSTPGTQGPVKGGAFIECLYCPRSRRWRVAAGVHALLRWCTFKRSGEGHRHVQASAWYRRSKRTIWSCLSAKAPTPGTVCWRRSWCGRRHAHSHRLGRTPPAGASRQRPPEARDATENPNADCHGCGRDRRRPGHADCSHKPGRNRHVSCRRDEGGRRARRRPPARLPRSLGLQIRTVAAVRRAQNAALIGGHRRRLRAIVAGGAGWFAYRRLPRDR